MKHKILFVAFFMFGFCCFSNAQKSKADSILVAKTLQELLTICRTVDFTDPKVTDSGSFYKAAPYIIYRGADKTRAWKSFANYNNPEEKKGVDNVCIKLNQTANQDTNYSISKYFTETESEGTWHILLVDYKKKGIMKTTAYAFLKIDDRFGLGDVD